MDFTEEFKKIKLPSIEELIQLQEEQEKKELLEEQKREKQKKEEIFNYLMQINEIIRNSPIELLKGVSLDLFWHDLKYDNEDMIKSLLNYLSENSNYKFNYVSTRCYSSNNLLTPDISMKISIRLKSTNKESANKESTNKESTNKESTNKESTNKESTNKESANKESANKESTNKESS